MRQQIKVLIGDDSPEFGCKYASALRGRGFYAVARPRSGLGLLEWIKGDLPDVVLTEAVMPGIDAIELIRRCELFGIKPFFIVTAVYTNEYIERQIMSFENAYFLLRPFDSDMLENLIYSGTGRHIVPQLPRKSNPSDDVEVIVTKLIHQIGVPAFHKGYHYLREAILLSYGDREMLDSVNEKLYPAVAKLFSTNKKRVERAIRDAIEIVWNRGDFDTIKKLFGFSVIDGKVKPTNVEFISVIVDNLKRRYPSSKHRNGNSR